MFFVVQLQPGGSNVISTKTTHIKQQQQKQPPVLCFMALQDCGVDVLCFVIPMVCWFSMIVKVVG